MTEGAEGTPLALAAIAGMTRITAADGTTRVEGGTLAERPRHGRVLRTRRGGGHAPMPNTHFQASPMEHVECHAPFYTPHVHESGSETQGRVYRRVEVCPRVTKMLCNMCKRNVDPEGHRWACLPKTFEVVCSKCGELRWPTVPIRPQHYVCARCHLGKPLRTPRKSPAKRPPK